MRRHVATSFRLLAILGLLASACTTSETGFIDLSVASVAPPPKAPKPPPACTADSECTDPKRPRCDGRGSCVACLVDGDCRDPAKPICFTEGQETASTVPAAPPRYTCVECSTDADCTRDPARALCAAARGKCVECVSDSDCIAGDRCESDGVCRRAPDGG